MKASPMGRKKTAAKPAGIVQREDGEPQKVAFTRENINSHLLAYVENPKRYSIVGLLTYLFKTFQDEPQELLAKIKVLTSRSKLEIDESNLRRAVLMHLFAVLKMKKEFADNLFSIFKSEGFLPHLISSFYFRQSVSYEDTNENLGLLFEELRKIYEPAASRTLQEFKEAVTGSVDDVGSIKESKSDDEEKESGGDEENKNNDEDEENKNNDEDEENKNNDEDEENNSSFELISLEDDEEIERVDEKLGEIFRTSLLQSSYVEYSLLIVKSIETLIKNNYVNDIEWLWSILYFSQFPQISQAMKYVAKDFVAKFGDKKQLFMMFRAAAAAEPQSVYGLYSLFDKECKEAFDHPLFIRESIARGNSELLIPRIDSKDYYEFFKPDMGEEYTECYKEMLMRESWAERLKAEAEREDLPEDLKVFAAEALKALERRKAKREKNRRRADKKKGVAKAAVGDVQSNSEEEGDKEGDVKTEEDVKKEVENAEGASETQKVGKKRAKRMDKQEQSQKRKLTFADKIGKKLAEKKEMNRKRFRYTNEDNESDTVKKSVARKKEYFKKKYGKARGDE